jgi:predicted TIM-barrel fold metal-dependent hydrolase
MASVADCPNVAVKISGLGQPGHAWSIESNGPIIRDLVAMFGPDRCMFASNYPVDSLCASFDDIARVLAAAISHLEPDDQDKIFYSNAIRIYRI